jgi:hypothetical protein
VVLVRHTHQLDTIPEVSITLQEILLEDMDLMEQEATLSLGLVQIIITITIITLGATLTLPKISMEGNVVKFQALLSNL